MILPIFAFGLQSNCLKNILKQTILGNFVNLVFFIYLKRHYIKFLEKEHTTEPIFYEV